jgi:hypothetical protein
MPTELPRIRGKVLEPYGDKAVTGYCRCGVTWAGENLCHCSVCHLTFLSVTGFDKHRTGPIGATRCRTPDQLTEVGMQPNEAGHWRRPMTDEARARLP